MKRLLVVLLFVVFCFALTCSTFASLPSSPEISIQSMESFLSLIESEKKADMLYTLKYSDSSENPFLDSDRELLAEKIECLQEEGFFVPEIEEEPKKIHLEYNARGCVEYTYDYGWEVDAALRGLQIHVVHYSPQMRNELKDSPALYWAVYPYGDCELDMERPYELRINGTPCTAYFRKLAGATDSVVAEYEGFLIELINVGSVEKYAESFDLSFSGEIRPAFIDEAFGASATYWWFVLPAVGAVVGCGLTLVVLFVIRKKKKSK